MKPLTLEYIAGFVDGEGTFTIRKTMLGRYNPFFAIGNTDYQVLQDIRKYLRVEPKIFVRHQQNSNWKTMYMLHTERIDDCKTIATLLEPYLRIKKEQAQIIMQFPRSRHIRISGISQTDFSTMAYAQRLCNKIQLLNKTGRSTQESNEDLQPYPDPQGSLFNLNQKEVTKP